MNLFLIVQLVPKGNEWTDTWIYYEIIVKRTLNVNASSLKQQSAGRDVTPLVHVILILSQPVFALSLQCCMLNGEATNTIFIVFGLTRPGLEPTIYHTRREHAHHYITIILCVIFQLYIQKTENNLFEMLFSSCILIHK